MRPSDRPGSSWGIHCHEGGCIEALVLERTTAVMPTHDDDYKDLCPALDAAAAYLGWRIYRSVWWCPTHVGHLRLKCARCFSVCPACSCAGGPRVDAAAIGELP